MKTEKEIMMINIAMATLTQHFLVLAKTYKLSNENLKHRKGNQCLQH